ncbi:uncharacterized protein [Capricornis sumatraensis]|uniref:uncharacterized protein isoform X1 n=1 Tax=Capricornis sumatraensis TaxID=34865 RepID=UPI003604C303
MIPEATLPNCQGHPHLLQISSSFLGSGIEKSSLPGCCECWSDSGKPVRPGIDEAVSKCFSQTGWSTTSPSPLSPVSRFSLILPQRSGRPQSAGLSVYQCKKAFPLRVTQVSSGSPVAKAQAPLNPAGHLPLASSGAPAAPDRERLDGGGGGAALEQHVFRRVTRRLAPASSRDAAAWIGPKPSSGILRGPGPRTRHPSTL